jgi:hypothetical protein
MTPAIYASATVRFVDPKLKLDALRLVNWTAPIGDGAVAVDWDSASSSELTPEMLERDAPGEGSYASLGPAALKAKNYDAWGRQFVTAVTARETLEVLRSPSTGLSSTTDESERDFRARLQQGSRETRDRALEMLRRKYAPRQAALDEKLRRAKQAVERESQQATGQKLQTMISMGATLVGALMGRKTFSASTIGRATNAARGVGRSMKESEDIERAQQTVQALEEQRQSLEDELKSEIAALEAAGDPTTEPLDRIVVKPKRGNVSLKLIALLWQ